MKLNVKLGKTYGFLTVLRRDITKTNRVYWICKCSCGIQKSVRSDNLGTTTISCGHYNKELIRKATEGVSSSLFKTNKQRFFYYMAVKPLYEQIRNRDNNCCVLCKTKTNLHIHHILRKSKYSQWILEPANLITVCNHCHLWSVHDGNTNKINLELSSELLSIAFQHELQHPTSTLLINIVKEKFKDILSK